MCVVRKLTHHPNSHRLLLSFGVGVGVVVGSVVMAMADEDDWLLKEEDKLYREEKERKEQEHDGAWYRSVSKEKLLLGIYVVLVVLVGTGNRVSFKLMQYSIINYTYFVSQLTTFIYIPVNGFVLVMKMLFTKDITPEMKAFPKTKFLVMGFLDSLAGIILLLLLLLLFFFFFFFVLFFIRKIIIVLFVLRPFFSFPSPHLSLLSTTQKYSQTHKHTQKIHT